MRSSPLRRMAWCFAAIGLAYLAWIRFDRSLEINRDFRLEGQRISDGIAFDSFVIGDWKFRRETWCHVAEYSPPYSLYVSVESVLPLETISVEIVGSQLEISSSIQDVTSLLTEQVVEISPESPKKTFCFKNALGFHQDFNLLLEYRSSKNGETTKIERCSLQLRAIESRQFNSLFLRRILY